MAVPLLSKFDSHQFGGCRDRSILCDTNAPLPGSPTDVDYQVSSLAMSDVGNDVVSMHTMDSNPDTPAHRKCPGACSNLPSYIASLSPILSVFITDPHLWHRPGGSIPVLPWVNCVQLTTHGAFYDPHRYHLSKHPQLQNMQCVSVLW